MQKSLLERFITKYNLAGAADAVLWTTSKTALSTKFISDDKMVYGVVSANGASFEEGEYGIYNTPQLVSLLGFLDDDIQVKVNKTNTKNVSLQLRDATDKVQFMLSEKSVIPAVPNLRVLPEFDVEIALDARFMEKFVKGKNALPDVETFTVLTAAEDKTQVVIGYSATINTNRAAIQIELKKGKGVERPINFSARYLKDILVANKDAKSGTMKVSTKGMAFVTFEIDGFTAEYYLVEVQTA